MRRVPEENFFSGFQLAETVQMGWDIKKINRFNFTKFTNLKSCDTILNKFKIRKSLKTFIAFRGVFIFRLMFMYATGNILCVCVCGFSTILSFENYSV